MRKGVFGEVVFFLLSLLEELGLFFDFLIATFFDHTCLELTGEFNCDLTWMTVLYII